MLSRLVGERQLAQALGVVRNMLPRRFIHCTKDAETVARILRHGFIIHPCERNVLSYFTKREEFRSREPQFFGMVSMHSFRFKPGKRFIRAFGPFAIEMSYTWIAANSFRQVKYLRKHGFYRWALSFLVHDALADVDRAVNAQYPEDSFRKMAYTNKNIAGILGATKWAQFLAVYEYMEPHKHKYQHEWRYARPEPFYNNDPIERTAKLLDQDAGWTRFVSTLQFKPADVVRVFAPPAEHEELMRMLPTDFSDVAIEATSNQPLHSTQRIQNALVRRTIPGRRGRPVKQRKPAGNFE